MDFRRISAVTPLSFRVFPPVFREDRIFGFLPFKLLSEKQERFHHSLLRHGGDSTESGGVDCHSTPSSFFAAEMSSAYSAKRRPIFAHAYITVEWSRSPHRLPIWG